MTFAFPFPTVAAVSFTGFPPVQLVRVLAASANYPIHRYALAVAVGRLPRFYLLALLGKALAVPGWIVLTVTVAFLAWPVVLVVKRRDRGEPEPITEILP